MLANGSLFQTHALDVARVNLQANANTQANAGEVHANGINANEVRMCMLLWNVPAWCVPESNIMMAVHASSDT